MSWKQEFELQKGITTYIRLQYPNVLFCASPGGQNTSATQGRRMKLAGYSKGFPDIFIYESRIFFNKIFHGLAIELKTKNGKPTVFQAQWIKKLIEHDYYAIIAYGTDEAITIIDCYLK